MDDIFDPGLLRENPRQMSAATLAFLGDAVYELLARQKLAVTTIPAGKLHRMAIGMVCAGAQSQAYEVLEPLLTEEELAVLKRGRNTHPSHTAKMPRLRITAGPPVWKRCSVICGCAGAPPAPGSCSTRSVPRQSPPLPPLPRQNRKTARYPVCMPDSGGFLIWCIGEESRGLLLLVFHGGFLGLTAGLFLLLLGLGGVLLLLVLHLVSPPSLH